MQLEITLFTDPACPCAFSAEPARQRLRWHCGDQLVWRTRMFVLTLDHKLGGPPEQQRYTAPSYLRRRAESGAQFTSPGFNPVETFEAAIPNLAPELSRRAKPESGEELLAWAGEPLATAEVAAVAQLDLGEARAALVGVARPVAAGADLYWRL